MEENIEILEIHIENKEPLELMEFVNSLAALSNEFNNYCRENNLYIHKDTKLYIEEIKRGSVIARLKALFNKTLDIYKTKTAISNFYNDRLKPSINCLLGKEETELSKQTIKNTSNIVSPNIKDNKGRITISLFDINFEIHKEIIVDKIELTNAEQNTIQNRARLKLEDMEQEEIKTNYKNVVFYWEQTKRGDNKPVDKGIIKDDRLPKRAIKVIMNPEIKEKMITGDVYGNNYIVNASILIGKNDKIIAYEITELIDIIPSLEE